MTSCPLESRSAITISFPVRTILLFLFFASVAIFYYLSANGLNFLGFGNLVFVDGFTWQTIIDETMRGGLEGLTDIRSSWLIFLIYYPFLLIHKPIFVILLNSFLLSISANLCRFRLACIPLIFATPFFILNSLLPNKEVLSLLLAILFFSALSKNNLNLALFIAITQVFVRDGVGYAFVLVVILYRLNLLNKSIIVINLFFLALMDSYLNEIQLYFELFVFERTLGFYESEGLDWSPYYIRIFGNITNLISRVPIFTIDGWLSITGFSLFLAGFSILSASVISLISITGKRAVGSSQSMLSCAFIIIISVTSISPLVQPRYMIPVALGYLFSCNIFDKINYYLIAVALAALFSLRLIYYFMNSLPEATNFWPVGFF